MNDTPYSLLNERAYQRQRVCEKLARLAYQTRKPDEEPFTLASGAKSYEYMDCRVALSHADVLADVCLEISARLLPRITAVGGLTMGADSLAVGTSLLMRAYTHASWFSVRKEAKNHGAGKLIEGDIIRMQNVCVVDDVCTSGGSTVRAIQACQEAGAWVKQVIVLVDREVGGLETIQKAAPNVYVQAIFTKTEIANAYARTRA